MNKHIIITDGMSSPDYYYTLNQQIREFDKLGITNWSKCNGQNGRTVWTFYCDNEQLLMIKLLGIKIHNE